MAVAKKTTARTSAKKAKKSTLKKLVGAFNPTSLKGGMALFALVFAAAGGGYFAYQSFAFSPSNKLYYFDIDAAGCSPTNPPGYNESCDQSVIKHDSTTGKPITYSRLHIGSTIDGPYTTWAAYGSSSHFAWYGPYRYMVVPPDAHGIVACYRYHANYDHLIYHKIYFDIRTSSFGGKVLTSRTLSIKGDEYPEYDDITTHSFCLKYNTETNKVFSGVEARIKVPDLPTTHRFDIVRTSLGYY